MADLNLSPREMARSTRLSDDVRSSGLVISAFRLLTIVDIAVSREGLGETRDGYKLIVIKD